MSLEILKIIVFLVGGYLSITLIFLGYRLLKMSIREWENPKINIVPVVNKKNNIWETISERQLPEGFD